MMEGGLARADKKSVSLHLTFGWLSDDMLHKSEIVLKYGIIKQGMNFDATRGKYKSWFRAFSGKGSGISFLIRHLLPS